MNNLTQNSTPSLIQQKKEEKETGVKQLNWKEFGSKVGWYTLQLILWFVIGARIVLACKFAQTNLMPTNSGCAPYTTIEPEFDSKEPLLNIDIAKIYNKAIAQRETFSTKITFPFSEKIRTNYFIELMKSIRENSKVSGIKMYMVSVFNSIFSMNYMMLNGMLNIINQSPFETLIILLGPYVLKYYVAFGYYISLIICIIFS